MIFSYIQKHKTLSIIILAIIIVALLLIIGKRRSDANVSTYEVVTRDISDSIQLAGTIDVKQRVDLGFASSGRVADVLVEEGQEVRENQVIAELDQNQLQASLIQAQANRVITEVDSSFETSDAQLSLETIEAQQNALVEGAYQEYLSGDLQAYLDDDTTRAMVSPEISGSYRGSEEGSYIIEFYSSSADSGYSFRYSGLEEGTATAYENQPGPVGSLGIFMQIDANSNYHNTQWVIPVPNTRSATYATRKSVYENALATRRRAIADAETRRNQVTGVAANTSREEAKKNQAQAQVNAVYAQLNDGKIRAPFDGIIVRNDLEIGQIVNAFTPVVTLFGSMDRELTLNVPEIYINKVEVGDPVELTLDAYPDMELAGEVTYVALVDTLVDGVPVYETTVAIIEPNERVRVGMNAKATVSSQQVFDAIAVPQHYIQEDDNGSYVTILDGSERTVSYVETGFEGNDGFVQILSGLEEGDTIIRPDSNE
jgi:HlyD family secretion protein